MRVASSIVLVEWWLLRSEEQQEREKKLGERMPTLEGRAGEFLKRRGSIGDHWETTVQRLAALSLLKFAALLIEVAAKAKYVVNVIDDLAEKAHFDKPAPEDSMPSKEFVSAFGTLWISLNRSSWGVFVQILFSHGFSVPTELRIQGSMIHLQYLSDYHMTVASTCDINNSIWWCPLYTTPSKLCYSAEGGQFCLQLVTWHKRAVTEVSCRLIAGFYTGLHDTRFCTWSLGQ